MSGGRLAGRDAPQQGRSSAQRLVKCQGLMNGAGDGGYISTSRCAFAAPGPPSSGAAPHSGQRPACRSPTLTWRSDVNYFYSFRQLICLQLCIKATARQALLSKKKLNNNCMPCVSTSVSPPLAENSHFQENWREKHGANV